MAGDGDLHVDPSALGTYGFDMQTYAFNAGMPISTKLSTVEVDSSGAFSGIGGLEAGVFAEGPVMQAAMEKQAYAFNAFLSDLTRGLMAIGNAANVCAITYNNTDIEAAEKMNLLGYAFATDPDAKRPAGVPTDVTTMLDQEMAGQNAAALPEAMTNPAGGTTANIYSGGYLTSYSDGSSKMVHSQADPAVPGGVLTVTTITGPGGVVLNTTTTKTTYASSGAASEYYRQSVTPGASVQGENGKTQKLPDSSVTTEKVENGTKLKTTTQSGGKDPEVQVTDIPKTTTAPTAEDVGPLQEAQDVLGVDAGKVDWRKGYQGVQAPG
ncbi:hypothetical protein [Cryptosporangium sp. NPDC048952]|uniref:hypothetical protein n=1 Tax=Cryptosporangium sp. NPDC048952 TaxID=3363961 RepID=UPI0037165819